MFAGVDRGEGAVRVGLQQGLRGLRAQLVDVHRMKPGPREVPCGPLADGGHEVAASCPVEAAGPGRGHVGLIWAHVVEHQKQWAVGQRIAEEPPEILVLQRRFPGVWGNGHMQFLAPVPQYRDRVRRLAEIRPQHRALHRGEAVLLHLGGDACHQSGLAHSGKTIDRDLVYVGLN